MPPTRARNDVCQYDDLADQWWRPDGAFAALHWLARARGALIPQPSTPNAVLLDVGCGAEVVRLDSDRAQAKLTAMRTYATQYPALNRGPVNLLDNEAIHGYEVYWRLP